MNKTLLCILLLVVLSLNSWAQADDMWDEKTTEEFNAQIDSIKSQVDNDANEEEYYEEAAEEEYEYEEASPEKASDYELELRQIDSTDWKKLKKDKRFNYKKIKKKKEQVKPRTKPWFSGLSKFFNSALFKFLLYLLLACFLGYIIYLFIKNNDISFRKNVKDEGIEQEDPWEDVRQFDDWELALKNAMDQKDYRLATRIYYLHTLHLLDKNQYLQYREDKTNWFYVQKLFGKDLHDGFKELTQSFDYIWYGEYELSEEQFAVLQTQFQNFHIRI